MSERMRPANPITDPINGVIDSVLKSPIGKTVFVDPGKDYITSKFKSHMELGQIYTGQEHLLQIQKILNEGGGIFCAYNHENVEPFYFLKPFSDVKILDGSHPIGIPHTMKYNQGIYMPIGEAMDSILKEIPGANRVERIKIYRWWDRGYGDKSNRKSIKRMIDIMDDEHGGMLIVAPEGTRTNGPLRRATALGSSSFLNRNPISYFVPVGFEGVSDAKKRFDPFSAKPDVIITVHFGSPLSRDQLIVVDKKLSEIHTQLELSGQIPTNFCDRYSPDPIYTPEDTMMVLIGDLLPREYWGVYGAHIAAYQEMKNAA